ncbi:hydroxyproline dehydrogenase [Anabrus simplex]|uniref:hydroxyproline dehydrogenase n=1 Tax=Anabrus simplex TaxID=316456 RepID=UPI0035A2CB6E
MRPPTIIQLSRQVVRLHSARCMSQCTALQFDDHRTVFRHKSTWELLRALLVLRACGSDLLVDNCLQLLRTGQRLLGERGLGWLLRPTVYAQFVAGQEEQSLASVAGELQAHGIRLMVAPTLEEDVGEGTSRQKKYDSNLEELLQLADMAQRHGGTRPCLQTKITALLSADTLRNLSQVYTSSGKPCASFIETVAGSLMGRTSLPDIVGLSRADRENLLLALARLSKLGREASTQGLRLLVDAEYSYVNPGCSLITMAMMAAFNQQRPVVSNTFQCYFKRALDSLSQEIALAEQLGVCFGAKIVRGAYLEKERQIDPSTTCASYEDTGHNYHRVLDRALEHAQKTGSRSLLIVATHNEEAVSYATQRLKELNVDPKAGHIVFAQIYGMAEQISMPLVHAGYLVYKSVPMGPLYQVLPYLARRVAENRSVLHGARKERQLLQQELWWRLTKA